MQWRFYRLIPAVMRQPYVGPHFLFFLFENGQNFSSWLPFMLKNNQFYNRVKQLIIDLLPHIKDIQPDPTDYGPLPLSVSENNL
ncbi:hypothetical protein KZZ20_07040 [Methylacidiphilum fumariolicum]|uniref:Uncharacterized protein n=1 Tax=Methylacidiphilum fumariolicum (strain SolV) TaxID=1156937 RepID=I0JXI8_METFB|nr:hypothetical protein [Candidatus Methylacidiphilum fumarolicum]MBW6415269.1 hypothetical protein [Candidatus Methylacidiphilum fumarolicum]CCG91957.1 hypothetical protein MFUM_270054 [Methylacidiphilum fumariolicum SolV]